MSKPFLCLTDQVDQLISRNLVINDRAKAEIFLLRNNYYNVINIYGKLFYIGNHSENFVSGTTFEELVSAIFFEHEIKGALFKSVVACEVRLKSILSYQFSQKYVGIHNYLDRQNYTPDPSKQKEIDKFISDVSEIMNKYYYQANDNAIKHYRNVHGSLPFWVLINFLDFGKIEDFYNILKPVDQQNLADEISRGLLEDYGISTILSIPDIQSYISSIRQLRNVLAHNGKLLGFMTRTSVPFCKELHGVFGFQPNSQRQDVFNIIIILIPFLSFDQYTVMYNTILKRSKQIKQKMSSKNVENVLNKLGFPPDFHQYGRINQNTNYYQNEIPLFLKKT